METDEAIPPTIGGRIHRFLDRWDWVIFATLVIAFIVYTRANNAPAVASGDAAPDFNLVSIEGEQHSLAEYRGKAVALTFWASWCGVCRTELPSLSALALELDPEKAAVVSVAVDSPLADVTAFGREARLAFPVLLGPRGVSDAYGIRGLPTTLIIGPDGIIRDVFTGYTLPGSVGRALRAAIR